MDLNEYQRAAMLTAIYPKDSGMIYTSLNLAGEAGEYAGQVAKAFRDDGGEITSERHSNLTKELGDVLWQVAAAAYELRISLNDLAAENLAKLADRNTRNKLQGSGDER